ncbi:hypothetical protein AVU36_gp81 [Escherichia phage CAjan]|uniref:Uncharacterized protein n=1 Tax=Escherichia phage CAjan TaxID=1610828 RepID=A0A0D4D9U4_9CAUD|nr:hypothetical protein AVU36_gp81 [Escherichia phage CAjan]AJT60566.1 hypothetical protein [Escherichia phage CAjan]
MITAQEARELSDKLDISEDIEFISDSIRVAATKGYNKVSLVTKYGAVGNPDTQDPTTMKIAKWLSDSGFTVLYYPSMDQRDNERTEVAW